MLTVSQYKRRLYRDDPADRPTDHVPLSEPPMPDAPVITLPKFEPPRLREEPADRPPSGDCTHYTCSAGHRWTPRLGIADCGCGAHQPVVAARFANCPVCNEPPIALRIRVDVTSMSIGVPMRCAGQDGLAVTGYLDLPIPAPEAP